MRVAIGGLWHETNTFAVGLTDLAAFRAYQFAQGDEILLKYHGTGTELGGFLAHAESSGWELIPTTYAAAVPSGIIARESYQQMLGELVGRLDSRPDGVLLSLHGAMVAEGEDDCEADILRRVRLAVGEHCPIVATFDIHGNVSQAMFDVADVLVGYDTYPHVDMFDRGREAAQILANLVETGARPAKAFRKLPLLTVPQTQCTELPPMSCVVAKLHEGEARSGMLCASVALGFPYADVRRAGVSVLAYSEVIPALARDVAEGIADYIWKRRGEFAARNIAPEEAARRVKSASDGPVILVDAADNVGGGAPGDGTVLLQALLEAGTSNAVVTIADPQAVREAARAGVGAELEMAIGAKHDRRHGKPVQARAHVVRVGEGTYTHRGTYMKGYRTSMGQTAVVEIDGVEVLLTERKVMPFDAEQLRCVGIDPAKKKAIVVKSAIAWKAAYGRIAREVLYVDTPGICSSNLSKFSYQAVPRPIFPLDGI